MKQSNDFAHDMLDLDCDPGKLLYYAARDVKVREESGSILLELSFIPIRHDGVFINAGDREPESREFQLLSYGENILRFGSREMLSVPDSESPMLSISGGAVREPLRLSFPEEGLTEFIDNRGRVRGRLNVKPHSIAYWSDLQPPSDPMLQLELFPDGGTPVRFMSYDQFFPGKLDSVSLAYTRNTSGKSDALFSFHAHGDECFYGTGERFSRIDLSGRTVTLENTDSLGNNSRKAYKNVPFYLSSRGYGLFIHTSRHLRLSFADISIRAVQGLIEGGDIDLFLTGGGTPEKVLYNYRCLTGFSPAVPLWSLGTWMSRMTYVSSEEVESIAERMRQEEYPCDVIHLDTGYFERDWICEWSFSAERFPDAGKFLKRLKEKGFYTSVWQTPNIGKENKLYKEASENGFLGWPVEAGPNSDAPRSDFSGQDMGGQIDFSNPEAVSWYKELLRGLLDLGVDCIKTDFGEKLDLGAHYRGLPAEVLHNLYSLLYQRAAFELSGRYAEHPLIWARAGWAGGQRYPVHWAGDTAATWDGMAASLRGGIQLGLSGYSFWGHDVAGFHGLPDFMNSRPDENLYLRWTQFGVFTSHMRYHGTSAREPWEYPGVSALVRSWLRLRYALIPCIMREILHCTRSGRSMISPLFLDYQEDRTVYHLDDQYLFGRFFLVAPVMNENGVRDVYLPKGEWINFFTGERLTGPLWTGRRTWPEEQMPVFAKAGSSIPWYPLPVLSTSEMDPGQEEILSLDDDFRGILNGPIGRLCGFKAAEGGR